MLFAIRSSKYRNLLMDESIISKSWEITSYRFRDVNLLQQALTHSSAVGERHESNERLEFLGDAVLGMVICEEIFRRNPDMSEGQMTKIKSSVVSRRTCARIARKSGLTDLLQLGKGVSSTGAIPPSISAAVFEAVIGAIFLDGGLKAAKKFILKQMGEEIDKACASWHHRDYKSLLQQYAQQHWTNTPQYELIDEKGPDHAKCFEVAVKLNNRRYPGAWGRTKKQAEQKAALVALVELGVLEKGDLDNPP